MTENHLQPNQFECTLYLYGYPQDGIILARGTAKKMSEMAVGTILRSPNKPSGKIAKVVSIRLEDDTPDGTKGRVIGVCQLVEPEPQSKHPTPYHPQRMEYK